MMSNIINLADYRRYRRRRALRTEDKAARFRRVAEMRIAKLRHRFHALSILADKSRDCYSPAQIDEMEAVLNAEINAAMAALRAGKRKVVFKYAD
jgi:hypothetical protein